MSRWVVSVERRIAAPAERMYALVADPLQHKDIDGSGSLVEPAPGRRFAWQSRSHEDSVKWRLLFGGRIWRYEFEPDGDGTLVRESWDLSEEPLACGYRLGSLGGAWSNAPY